MTKTYIDYDSECLITMTLKENVISSENILTEVDDFEAKNKLETVIKLQKELLYKYTQ